MPFGRQKAPNVSDFVQEMTATAASPRSLRLGTVSFYRRTPKSLLLSSPDKASNRSPNFKLRIAPTQCPSNLWVQIDESSFLPQGEWASKMRSGQFQWPGCPSSAAADMTPQRASLYQQSLVSGNAHIPPAEEVEEEEALLMIGDEDFPEIDDTEELQAHAALAAAALVDESLSDEERAQMEEDDVSAKIFDFTS
mmetsp:Transcript_59251/g.95806  ORF Transcript_59251/g.95806 Transcript_59251/m.95806 type:complete len:195 (+) Transcript_59251:48-632(+)|eukprot:CAMPEP_0179445146 /NCGR_PEP_ID=MMETSP0799-20121207/28598_1 /TAXON_ID=46947 /ORGANISM="Geminigera cryophila, Strain CCMP2564" /LENGTH=194 /DNA_ID=CAMNT_0021232909 /DNA_START=106 /DNA_END=690 /DNA_ORIENTATION=+